MNVIKVCFLNEEGFPFQYDIFTGPNTESRNPREFFSNLEWEYVLKNRLEPNIQFCDYTRIHLDDSIYTVKKKIAHFQMAQEILIASQALE